MVKNYGHSEDQTTLAQLSAAPKTIESGASQSELALSATDREIGIAAEEASLASIEMEPIANLAHDEPGSRNSVETTALLENALALPASEELDRVVVSYTYRAAREDPATAFTWAESVVDERNRLRLMTRVASVWKASDSSGFTSYIEDSDLTDEQKETLINPYS